MKIKARVKSLDEILKSGEVFEITKHGDVKMFYNNQEVHITSVELGFCGEVIELENVDDSFYDYKHSTIALFKKEWLEDIEEVIDWSKVEVDTEVLVSVDGHKWHKRHFKEYTKDGLIVIYSDGQSSWTTDGSIGYSWTHVKLHKEGGKND